MPGRLARLLLSLLLALTLLPAAAFAARDTNSYDGNIYALYAGNGSLVPPRSTLAQALEAHRTAVVVYYLDDASASKRFAAVVSELQRVWGNSVELIPIATDPLQNRRETGAGDPAHYWTGRVPQVVVIDPQGQVVLDATGQVDIGTINRAVSQATGIALLEGQGNSGTTVSFNELNSEVQQP
jgi:hypothetical protein